MAGSKGISLRVCEEEGIDRTAWPLTRGVALPEGAVHDAQALRLECEDGRARTNSATPAIALARRQH